MTFELTLSAQFLILIFCRVCAQKTCNSPVNELHLKPPRSKEIGSPCRFSLLSCFVDWQKELTWTLDGSMSCPCHFFFFSLFVRFSVCFLVCLPSVCLFPCLNVTILFFGLKEMSIYCEGQLFIFLKAMIRVVLAG